MCIRDSSTRAPENWRAHGARKRASCEPLRRRTVDVPHRCVSLLKRYTKMRSNRPFAAAAACKSRARALHARVRKLARAWTRNRAMRERLRRRTVDSAASLRG
eukprot:11182092-Lingulodinium_polyedra.AAC.1